MRFEHGSIRLEIDEATGSIIEVVDTRGGRQCFDASPDLDRLGRLFRVIAPIERWSSHHADSWSSGPPELHRHGDTISIRYADLRSERGSLGVSAEVKVRPGGPSEAVLTLSLASRRADGDVTDILFPWLGGWRLQDATRDAITLGGARALRADHFPFNRGMTFSRWHQREFFTYPIDLYAPWVDVSGPSGGVGLISYQRAARNLGAFIENLAGYQAGLDLSIGFNHYAQLRAGETWTSPEIGISIHEADWHSTADRYTDWADTWFVPPPTPRWARTSIGFQNVLFRGFDGTPIRPLESIPDVARAGVDAGVPHLSVWDYILLGEYGKLDDVPMHGFSDGDRATLRKALAAARRSGARLSSLQNYRLVKPTSRLYREHGAAEVCRRYDGSPFVEEYSGSLAHALVITTHVGPMVHPIDARVATVRSRVLSLVDASLDLGFDSQFYDQPFENWPSYHPDRGDDGPDGAHAGTVSLLREVRALLARRSPEGILIGEYADVFGSEAIDLWMSWYTDFDDLRRSIYSIPQTMQSWVVDADASAATRAFVAGAQLCLTTHGGEGHLGDVPEFARHVARLADLRARADRLWTGRFRDHEGLTLETDEDVTAAAFMSPGGPAVIVGAVGAPGRAVMAFEAATGGHADERRRPGQVLRLDGRTEETSGDRLVIDLDADEVAVWYP